MRARRVDVCRGRLQAQGNQMALPDRRVRSEVDVAQSRPAAPPHPNRQQPASRPVPAAQPRRRRVREPQTRMGALPLRVRGADRIRLHADLIILTKLVSRLATDRSGRRTTLQVCDEFRWAHKADSRESNVVNEQAWKTTTPAHRRAKHRGSLPTGTSVLTGGFHTRLYDCAHRRAITRLASATPAGGLLPSQRIATGPGGPPAVPTKGSGDAQRSIS